MVNFKIDETIKGKKMKNQLNRELIEGLNESNNEEFLENVNNFVYNLITNVINDISLKSPFIRLEKCVLQPVNEMYLGAFSQLSEYTYFLGIANTQIELNSKTKKNFWKNLWRDFKAAWRLGKSKYKKSKKGLSTETIDKYKLSDLRHDMVKKMSEYLSESSIIYEYTNYISMIGKDDFGTNVKVNIYVCCFDEKKSIYKLFNERKNRFFPVDFGKRFENIEYKIKNCGSSFADMIKIFNALFSKAFNKIPNQILIESLLYCCPNVLFDENDIYKTFVNVANFIRIANPENFVSVCNSSKNIFNEPLIVKSNSQVDFSKIINMLDRYKY